MKTRPWEPSCPISTDGRTDMMKQFCRRGWKYKSQVTLVHFRKAYRENEGTAPLFLNPGTKWRWVISQKKRLLYPEKRNLGARWTEGLLRPRSGRFGEQSLLLSLEIKPRTVQPMAMSLHHSTSRGFLARFYPSDRPVFHKRYRVYPRR